MERLEFDCDYDLADAIETLLEEIDDDYPLVSVYGKYDVIKTLLEDLITEGFSIKNEIQLEDYEISYYDKEFVLYVEPDGVNVEKVFAGDTYYYGSGNVSFVHEDCSSTLLKYIESDMIYEFGYSDDECDVECKYDSNTSESTYVSRDKDGTPTGFQKTWFTEKDGVSCYSSFSHYSSNVNVLREIAEDFGVKL